KVRSLAAADRNEVLVDDRARNGLIHYYEGQIHAAADVAQGHYDFPRAEALAQDLRAFYPDSATVKEDSDRLARDKAEALKSQGDRFDADLQRGVLISEQGTENVEAVLAIVRRIDPQHHLLHDPRLPGAYAEQTRTALRRANPTLAQKIVDSGLKL